MNSTEESPSPSTTFDAGDGWEGDSGGSGIRGQENPTVKAPATTTPVAPAVTAPPATTEADDPDPGDADTTPATTAKKRTWAERQAEEKTKTYELKKEREAEARSLESVRAERARLERELAAMRTKPAAEPPPPTPLPARPEWEAYENEGKSFDQFIKDHAAWSDAKEEAARVKNAKESREEARRVVAEERQKAEAQSRTQRLEDEFIARMDAVKAANPDLTELAKHLDFESEFLSTVVFRHQQGAELYNHLARHPDEARSLAQMPFTQPFLTAVRESDDPTSLLSYLAQNRSEFDRIAQLSTASALVALGKIDSRFARREDAPFDASSSAARVTKAAPPLRHVAGRQSTGGADALEDKNPDDWTHADVQKLRERAQASRR